MEWTIPWTFHGPVHVDSIWIPWNFQIQIPWTIPIWIPWTIPHGILRDLIRIEINVFKFNVIPLLYIYISEKKMHNARIEPWRSVAHANTRCSQLSHAGIYFQEIDGIIMTPDRVRAAARQMRLVVTQLSRRRLSFQPPPSSTTAAANHHQRPPVVHRYPPSTTTTKLPGESHSPPPLTENHESTGCGCHVTQLDEQPPSSTRDNRSRHVTGLDERPPRPPQPPRHLRNPDNNNPDPNTRPSPRHRRRRAPETPTTTSGIPTPAHCRRRRATAPQNATEWP
jgi:hypothetical protein